MPICSTLLGCLALSLPRTAPGPAAGPDPGPGPLRFDRVVIDADLPGGYQVEVADVDGDGRPDVVALGGSTLAWYRNPTWTKRIISGKAETPDIISSATADLDGDGRAEIAVACDFGMNTPARGRLLLAVQGPGLDAPWTFRPVADVPSIHRLRWGDLDGDGRPDLVVAPIFGPAAAPPAYDQDPASLSAFFPGADPKAGRWDRRLLARRPVIHAIEVLPPGPGSRATTIYTADNLGVMRYRIGPGKDDLDRIAGVPAIPGAAGQAPKRGSSEVHLGRLADGREFLATIDPWHGSEVAVCLREPGPAGGFGPRSVIDATLDDGHALWVADVDGDGNSEIFAGHRGKGARVSAYRFDGRGWSRTVLDPALAAQDLRGGDLDGDGRPDVVAVGGRSHNVVWFRPSRPAGP